VGNNFSVKSRPFALSRASALALVHALALALAFSFSLSSALAQPSPPAPPPTAAPLDPRFAEIARAVKSARAAMLIPGISVAVVERDQLVFTTSDGFADLENQIPADAHTLWRIASVSKPIAATAAMQLVERGALKLDEPIWTYVPWYPRKGPHVITVRHVLTHTSGIRHYAYEAGEKESTEFFPTVEAGSHVNGVDREPLRFTPGTAYLYSSYAYLLVAGLVERASGLGYEGYLREKIFAPAGMTTACLDKNRDLIPHRARFYRKTDAGTAVVNAPFVDVSYKWSAGGLLATPTDLARYAIALDTGKLLSAESLAQVYADHKLANGKATAYGLGWHVATDATGRFWAEHSGGATGGAAYLLHAPRDGLAIAILCNLERPGELKKLAHALAASLLK
jgi:CubicO group peptidase (beta-lactamase class C family)